MKKTRQTYEPHLSIGEVSLGPGKEWLPQFSGWALIQVGTGSGYWLQSAQNHHLEPGMVLLLSPRLRTGIFRASQLGELSLYCLPVELERLLGVLSLEEQRVFERAASKEESAPKLYAADSSLAEKMKALCVKRGSSGAAFRLHLLQLFFDVFANELQQETPQPEASLDAKARLSEFLKQTPAAELINVNITQLAQMARCGPRHLSRIFYEVVGVSFREKHTELRLARARELLATTESKVVDIALESGYQSVSLFSLMFTRRFGVSPGRWREKLQNEKTDRIRRRRKESPSDFREMTSATAKQGA